MTLSPSSSFVVDNVGRCPILHLGDISDAQLQN